MVAVTEFSLKRSQSMCVFVSFAMYSSANGERKRRRGEVGGGAGDGCEVSGAPTLSLASDFTLG